jgi:hypothetical protein
MVYHLESRTFRDTACCGNLSPGDIIISNDEAEDPNGRHFNCVECHKVVSGGLKHVRPAEE